MAYADALVNCEFRPVVTDGGKTVYKEYCTIESGGGGGDLNYGYYYDNNEVILDNYGGNPYSSHLTEEDINNAIVESHDKTAWDSESIADLIHIVERIQWLITYLKTTYNLSDAMIQKLDAAYSQGVKLIDRLSSGIQISNHVLNQEFGLAGSELAVFIAAASIEQLASGLTLMATSSLPAAAVISTGAIVVSAIYLLPEIESLGDDIAQNIDFEALLENSNFIFDLPNIYQFSEDVYNAVYCAALNPNSIEYLEFCMIPPIVLDMDQNGIDFIDVKESKFKIDVNNDGVLDDVTWPKKGNAVLFADWNSSGILDSRTEIMFSLFSRKKMATDLEGLKLFDYQNDGIIDSQDNVYEKLFIWDDYNENGICEASEVKPLASLNLTLNLKSTKPKNRKAPKGVKYDNIFKFSATYKNENGDHVNINDGLAASVSLKAKIN
ncbi:hypothetical protein [Thalassotalea fusca]